LCRDVQGNDRIVMGKDLGFADRQIPVEHVKEFTLDASYIPLSKDTRTKRPMYVFQRRIIDILG
jgi:hypothetical protein